MGTIPEVGFEYEAYARIPGYALFITEEAVAENQPIGSASEGTSDAFCGVRFVSSDGETSNYEVFGRPGHRIVDIVGMDQDFEEVELPTPLGSDDEALLTSVAEITGISSQPTTR